MTHPHHPGSPHLHTVPAHFHYLQVAFQYTTVVPISSTSTQSSVAAAATSSIPYGAAAAGPSQHGNGADGGSSSFLAASAPAPAPGLTVHRMALVRRLRVVTLRLSVTRDAMDLYRHCSTDAVLCLLMHKVAKVTAGAGPPPPLPQAGRHTSTPHPHTNGAGVAPSTSGRSVETAGTAAGSAADVEVSVPPQIAQARVLLRDWLVLLVAGYQRAKHPSMTVKQLAGQQVRGAGAYDCWQGNWLGVVGWWACWQSECEAPEHDCEAAGGAAGEGCGRMAGRDSCLVCHTAR